MRLLWILARCFSCLHTNTMITSKLLRLPSDILNALLNCHQSCPLFLQDLEAIKHRKHQSCSSVHFTLQKPHRVSWAEVCQCCSLGRRVIGTFYLPQAPGNVLNPAEEVHNGQYQWDWSVGVLGPAGSARVRRFTTYVMGSQAIWPFLILLALLMYVLFGRTT